MFVYSLKTAKIIDQSLKSIQIDKKIMHLFCGKHTWNVQNLYSHQLVMSSKDVKLTSPHFRKYDGKDRAVKNCRSVMYNTAAMRRSPSLDVVLWLESVYEALFCSAHL